MNSNIWKKRRMKMKGFFWEVFSYVMFRHSSANRERIMNEAKKLDINRLHIGCGDVLLEDWLNIKFEKREEYGKILGVQGSFLLNYNLLKPWPIADSSIDNIAGSHVIEHLDLNAGIKLTQSSFKALKAGGVIRLSCPDLELYAKNYVQKNEEFYGHEKIKEWCAFKSAETPGEIFAAKAYDSGGAHKWFYDFDSLKHILEQAGFVDIKRVARLEGKTPDLDKIELAQRELETVYVEGVKPL